MNNDNLTNEILDTIEKQQLEPKSRASFVVRNGVLWTVGLLSVLVGSAATAVIIYMLDNDDWDVYQDIHGNAVTFLFAALPYFWFVLFALFLAAAYANIHYTKRGYKFRFRSVVVVVLGVTVVSGSTLYAAGLGEAIDVALTESIPVYNRMVNHRQERWSHPERGQLGGQIISVEPGVLMILDYDNNAWTVITTQATIPPLFDLHPAERVRVIGTQADAFVFVADRIVPWYREKPPRMFFPAPVPQY